MSADRLYKDGDIVWVRLGNNWWPAEVIDGYRQPLELLGQIKFEPYCVVKFFDEDRYEIVKRSRQIYPFKCDKKVEFIRKGLALLNVNYPEMKKFPVDVEMAERLTRRVVESDLHVINDRPYSILKAIIGQKLTTVRNDDYNNDFHASSSKSQHGGDSFTKIINITPMRTIAPEVSADLSSYRCNFCDFTSRRQNVMILHNKTHSSGGGNYSSSKRGAILHKSNDNSFHLSPPSPQSSIDKDEQEMEVGRKCVDEDEDTVAALNRVKIFEIETPTKGSDNKIKGKRYKVPKSKRPSTIIKVEKVSTSLASVEVNDSLDIENQSIRSQTANASDEVKSSDNSNLQRSCDGKIRVSVDVGDNFTRPEIVKTVISGMANNASMSSQKSLQACDEEMKMNPQDIVRNLEADWSDGEELIAADPNVPGNPVKAASKAFGESSDMEDTVGGIELVMDSEVIVDPELVADTDSVVGEEGANTFLVPTSKNTLLSKSSNRSRIRNIPKKDRRDIILKEFHQNENILNTKSSVTKISSDVVAIGYSNNSNSPEIATTTNNEKYIENADPSSPSTNVSTIHENVMDLSESAGDIQLLETDKSNLLEGPQRGQDIYTVTTEITEPDISSVPSNQVLINNEQQERSCFDFEEEEETDNDSITPIANFKKMHVSPVKNTNLNHKSDNRGPPVLVKELPTATDEESVKTDWKDKQLAEEIDSLLMQTKATIMDIAVVASATNEDVPVKTLPIKERGKRIFKSRNRSRAENLTKITPLTLRGATEDPEKEKGLESDFNSIYKESTIKSKLIEDKGKIEQIEQKKNRDEITKTHEDREKIDDENHQQNSLGRCSTTPSLQKKNNKKEDSSERILEEKTVVRNEEDEEEQENLENYCSSNNFENNQGHLLEPHPEDGCAVGDGEQKATERTIQHDEEVIPMIRHAPVEVYKDNYETSNLKSLSNNCSENICDTKHSGKRSSPNSNSMECDQKVTLGALCTEGSKIFQENEKDSDDKEEEECQGIHENSNVTNDIESDAIEINRLTSPADENSSIGISEAGAEFGSPTSMLEDERLPINIANDENLITGATDATYGIKGNPNEVSDKKNDGDVGPSFEGSSTCNERINTEVNSKIEEQMKNDDLEREKGKMDNFTTKDKFSHIEENINLQNPDDKNKIQSPLHEIAVEQNFEEEEGISQFAENYNERVTPEISPADDQKDKILLDRKMLHEIENTKEELEVQNKKDDIKCQELREIIVGQSEASEPNSREMKEIETNVEVENNENANGKVGKEFTCKADDNLSDIKKKLKQPIRRRSTEEEEYLNKISTSRSLREANGNDYEMPPSEFRTAALPLPQADLNTNLEINDRIENKNKVIIGETNMNDKDDNINILPLEPNEFESNAKVVAETKSATDDVKYLNPDASSKPLPSSDGGKHRRSSSRKRRSHIKITPRKRLAESSMQSNDTECENYFKTESETIDESEKSCSLTTDITEAATLTQVVEFEPSTKVGATIYPKSSMTIGLTEMRSFRSRRKTNLFDAVSVNDSKRRVSETTEKISEEINRSEYSGIQTVRNCDTSTLIEAVQINVDAGNPFTTKISNTLAASVQHDQQKQQLSCSDRNTNKSNLSTTTSTTIISKGIASSLKRKKSIEDDIPSFIIERPSLSSKIHKRKDMFPYPQNTCPHVKITRKENVLIDQESEEGSTPEPQLECTPATSPDYVEEDQVVLGMGDGNLQTYTVTSSAKQQNLNMDNDGGNDNIRETLFDIGNMPILLANPNEKICRNDETGITHTSNDNAGSEGLVQPVNVVTIENDKILQTFKRNDQGQNDKVTQQQQHQHHNQKQSRSRKKSTSSPCSKRDSIDQQLQQSQQYPEETSTINQNRESRIQTSLTQQKQCQEQQRVFHSNEKPENFAEEKSVAQLHSCQSYNKQIGTDSRGNKYVIIKTPPADLVIQQQQQEQRLTLPELQQNSMPTNDQHHYESGLTFDQSLTSAVEAAAIEEIVLSEPQQFKQRSPAAAATGGRKQVGNTIALPTTNTSRQQHQRQHQQQHQFGEMVPRIHNKKLPKKFSSPLDQQSYTSKSSSNASTQHHSIQASSRRHHNHKSHHHQNFSQKSDKHHHQNRNYTDLMAAHKEDKKTSSCPTSGRVNQAVQRRTSHTQASQPSQLHHFQPTKKTKKLQENQRDVSHLYQNCPQSGSSSRQNGSDLLRTEELQPANSIIQTQTHSNQHHHQHQLSPAQSSAINEEQLMQIESEEQIDGTSKILAVPTQPISGYNETFLLCTLVNNSYKPIDNVPLYLDHDLNQLVPVPLEALDGQPSLIVTHPPPEDIVNQLQTSSIEQDDNEILADTLNSVEAVADPAQQMIYIQPAMEDNETGLPNEVVDQTSMDDPSGANSDDEDGQMAVFVPPDCSDELPSDNAVILNIEGQQIILDAATFAHLLANPDANTQLITDDGTEFVLTREVLAALEAQQDSQEETTMREQQQQLEQHLQQAHQIREAGPTDILAVALAGTDLYTNEVLEIETSQGIQLVGADGIVFQSGSIQQAHLTPPITAHTSETNALLNQTPIMSTLEKPSTSGKRKPTESSAAELFAAAASASNLSTCRPNLEDSLAVIGVTAQSSSSVPASLELPITVTNPAIAPKSTMAGPTAPVGFSSISTVVTEAVQFHCLPHRTGLVPGEARIYNDPGS